MSSLLVITQILSLRQNAMKPFEISYESKGLSDSTFEVAVCSGPQIAMSDIIEKCQKIKRLQCCYS